MLVYVNKFGDSGGLRYRNEHYRIPNKKNSVKDFSSTWYPTVKKENLEWEYLKCITYIDEMGLYITFKIISLIQ